ncbi:MAG: DoxX family protein [Ferruginibacter sp.]
MNLNTVLILISSFSFLSYGITYFLSPQMKNEFKRFGLEKAGALTAILELLGAVGLLVGLKFHLILLISTGGLALLMFMGVAVRIKVKDSFWISLPALFFLILNTIIFFMSMPHSNLK